MRKYQNHPQKRLQGQCRKRFAALMAGGLLLLLANGGGAAAQTIRPQDSPGAILNWQMWNAEQVRRQPWLNRPMREEDFTPPQEPVIQIIDPSLQGQIYQKPVESPFKENP